VQKQILLVEDEDHLLKTIRLNLELEGYTVLSAIDGSSALKIFEPQQFDLVVLDVMLPLLNGFDVCSAIREKDKQVPILFLTAKGTSDDKIHGLRLGADDYLVKPFHLEEFLLRVNNLVRRSIRNNSKAPVINTEYTFGSNSINFSTFEAWGNKQSWALTKREVELLRLLIIRSGEVISRDEILSELWSDDALPTARTIDNFILNFRKYFEHNPREPEYFHSIRGVGYKFTG
jgi:two-component system alkaline phosphatase synthesis response regulator PhoP